jgi:hypothetical protein
MHTHTLDFGTVLKDRLRPPDQPIVMPGREGPSVPIHLRGGFRIPNRTITPVGITTIHMDGGAMCTDNASDTSSTALSRIFRLIKAVNLRGIK